MTQAEALILAAQLKIDLPKRGGPDALLAKLLDLNYKLGVEHDTGNWVVYDANDNVLARCE